MGKYVLNFSQGSKEMKRDLGGKGASLAEMTKIGLPVPPGFTITTPACLQFYENNQKLWDKIKTEIILELEGLEKVNQKGFGDPVNPLLISVRSGAVISMPGMMDTILNLGLNDETVIGLANATNNPRFAYDSYRRFIQMFSDVVMQIPKYLFEQVLDKIKLHKNYQSDIELTEDDLLQVVLEYKKIYKKELGFDFPIDPLEQLFLAVEAVFKSWNNPRAIIYRNINDIPHDLGTAVNIQSMVFGNMGETSGTGVAFTRNPSTGENKLFGEFLVNAQGEDVVAGIRTPKSINELQEFLPEVYNQFIDITNILENHYSDMQDIEFTIEKGKLYILQTRNGKRTANAAINIAVSLVLENKISKDEAIMRVDPKQLDQLLHPNFNETEMKQVKVLTSGLPASPGAASGKIYFTAEDVVSAKERGEKSILVRQETSPEDIEGMLYAEAILTSRGGMTSHAAVVARGMGKCCIAGCSELIVDEVAKQLTIGDLILNEGDIISLDGINGNVYLGHLSTVDVEMTGNFGLFMSWVDNYKLLKVRANADTPTDAEIAVTLGAEGIGLCRTEHMFFDEERIFHVRKMILAKTKDERQIALDKLLDMQIADFVGIFKKMEDRPCTIRLLDPPLHEFLPKKDEDIKKLANDMQISEAEIYKRIVDLQEFNPMLGHRGCRLAITYPEIYLMQTEAIIEACLQIKDHKITPEIMIPLIADKIEFKSIKDELKSKIKQILTDKNEDLNYLIGTMIEVPRAALCADEIAEEAEFFSFGTNDLTQLTYGFSRDDSNIFLKEYLNKNILPKDPFQVLDQKGVGKLMDIAINAGKKTNPLLKIGICGEHGGEPSSVEFCHKLGLNYVSCSPYRVPIAKLAAAQAAIKGEDHDRI